MTERYMLKSFTLLLWSYIVSFSVGAAAESATSFSVQILSGFDDSPMWIGVLKEDGAEQSIHWSYTDTREISVEVSDTRHVSSLVVLKRDSVPVIESLTPELISDGITVELSEGKSITGKVIAVKGGSPIAEGLVKVQFDENLSIPLPEDDSVFTWELEEDGTFEIEGLPLGEHTVSVLAPGYMPMEQQVLVKSTDQPLELIFHLAKAAHVRGRIVDWMYQSSVEGTFDLVITPSESQTAEVKTEFDDEGYFQLGPFAEDVQVELTARTAGDLRSRPIEVTVPADELEIEVYQWIRVLGTVQDQDTGEPIPQFSFITGRLYDEVTEISDASGQFEVEISEERHFLFVSILATGYSFWASDAIRVDRTDKDEFDLGVIELEPAVTVRGRVLDQDTREPIERATVYRDDTALGYDARATYIVRWSSWKLRTTTNAEGEFMLDGLPSKDGAIWVGADGYSGVRQNIEDVSQSIEIELKPSGSISGQVVTLSGEPVAARINFAGGSIKTVDGNFYFAVGAGSYKFKAFADSGTSKLLEITVENGQSIGGVRLVIEVIGRVNGTIAGLLDEETAQVWVDGVGGLVKYGVTNGAFEITGVPQGRHTVGSKTSLGREQTGTVAIDESLEGRVELIFSGSSVLSGRLIAGSRDLADHNIRAIPVDSSLPTVRTRTIRDGSYRLEGLVNGNYQVEVPMYDFTQQVVVQGDTVSNLQVDAVNRVSGKVTASGTVEGAEVRLIGGMEGEKISLWTKVRANGSYLFKGVPSGTYTIRITHPDYAEVSRQIDVYEERVKFDIQVDEMKKEFED